MTLLCKLANKYKTDKGPIDHKYTKLYHQYFKDIRFEKLKICEIGIAQGNSIRMWLEYFPNSLIVGVDKSIDCLNSVKKDKRFSPIIGNTYHANTIEKIKSNGPYDIIIDDGSHSSKHILKNFEELNSCAKRYYFVEDLDHKNAKDALAYFIKKENITDYLLNEKDNVFIDRNKMVIIKKGDS